MKEIKYDCIKEITKELKKRFKGIQANSYGYCCNSDYDAFHKYVNEDDYVCAKIFRGGLNNQFYVDRYTSRQCVEIGKDVYYSWYLTNFKLEDVIATMQEVADKYGYKVETPEDTSKCIRLYVEEENENGRC